MRKPLEMLEAYRNGDTLSDDELVTLAISMETIAASCHPFGDLFTLQARYASEVAATCRMYLAARRENTKRRKSV